VSPVRLDEQRCEQRLEDGTVMTYVDWPDHDGLDWEDDEDDLEDDEDDE
jgi:hypothetical protein